jgi:hypothetical protein
VKLTTHFHVMPRFMPGTLPVRLRHVFMAWCISTRTASLQSSWCSDLCPCLSLSCCASRWSQAGCRLAHSAVTSLRGIPLGTRCKYGRDGARVNHQPSAAVSGRLDLHWWRNVTSELKTDSRVALHRRCSGMLRSVDW